MPRRGPRKTQTAEARGVVARRTRRTWLVAGVAAIALVAVVASLPGLIRKADRGSTAAAPQAPDLAFELFDGSRTSFSDFEGSPLVLNFWASWCPACVAEMPDFEKVSKEYAGEVQFLGLDTQDTSRRAAEELAQSTGVSYLLGEDPTGVIYREFGGIAMPTTVFIDATGSVVATHSGALFADDLADRIDELFGSRP